MPDYDYRLPAISDLEKRAKRRMPKFAFDYLSAGIGSEYGLQRNRAALDAVQLSPRYMVDVGECDTTVELFGENYALPIGVSPVGLAGMMWPNAEVILARAAKQANIPFTLSTIGTTRLEKIAEVAEGRAWYQLYPTVDFKIAEDIVSRAAACGYKVLVVTVDVPVGPKRDRDMRNDLSLPPRPTPATLFQAAIHPQWSLNTLIHGVPQFEDLAQYAAPDMRKPGGVGTFVSEILVKGVSRDYLQRLRDHWQGALIIKGLLTPQDAEMACEISADGIIVSNHGGRQLDAAPASIEALPAIAQAVGDRCTVLMDSGIRNGIDVLRALACGAKFTFSGRSFYYGVGALGQKGGQQSIGILRDEIESGLNQLGYRTLAALRAQPPLATICSRKPI